MATAMTAAWVATLAVVTAGIVPALAIIWRGAAATPPDLTRFAYDIETLTTYAVSSTAALVSIAAPSVVIWRTRTLPRWLAARGAAEVALNVVDLAGLSTRHGALAGGYAAGIGPLLWMLWVAAASVSMARAGRGPLTVRHQVSS